MQAEAQYEETEEKPIFGVDENGQAKTAQDALKDVAEHLDSIAKARIGRRSQLEQRWLEDYRQYYGIYDEQVEARFHNTTKSRLFLNQTRPKTRAMAARLKDVLMPTDDRNWGIKPTPVPELTLQAEKAMQATQAAKEKVEQATPDPDEDPTPKQMGAFKDARNELSEAERIEEQISAVMEQAREAARLMADEIDDQLKNHQYEAECRDVIDYACKLGTGVLMGPIRDTKGKRRWVADKANPNLYKLSFDPTRQPRCAWVDTWAFFPDMDARRIEDSDLNLVRHLVSPNGMRQLSRNDGFSKDAIKRILSAPPKDTLPNYINQMRLITDDHGTYNSEEYTVWQALGSIDHEMMLKLAMALDDPDIIRDIEENGVLADNRFVIWFCQGEILACEPYPLDSGDPMFSVYCIEKDDGSIFGYGIPNIMSHPQRGMNSAWRMMFDNAGISAGPQIVVNRDKITPADGKWEITPNKIWYKTGNFNQGDKPFETFDIPMQQAELAGMIGMCVEFVDDETSMPAIAQGDQGDTTKTAAGMSLLMNSYNVVFRSAVKAFDDDLTTPTIRRMYDWNMQFSDKAEIKGDYSIDARGSGVLLVREMQANNLMNIAMNLSTHPVYGPMIKHPDVLRALFRAHMLHADEHILSDSEIKKVVADLTNEKDPEDKKLEMEQNLRQLEIDLRREMNNQDNNFRLKVAQIEAETKRMIAGQSSDVDMEAQEVKLEIANKEMEHKERSLAVEAAMTPKDTKGGGGTL